MTFSLAELGQFALILALGISLAASLPLRLSIATNPQWQGFGKRAAATVFALVAASFVALAYAFATSDFSVALVAAHSQTRQPLAYKIAGAWGQHEGSLLLWLLVLSACGAWLGWRERLLPPAVKASALAVIAALSAAFAALSLITSNPFARLTPAPLEGRDLNPLLQDPGLVIHPPLLYIGYVGFSICFAVAVAALLHGTFDRLAARALRPWALFAWMALTAGLALGSWWSYYELGWGGWWFWDPVENVALLPWLIGTALLHSLRTVATRATLLRWTLWLALAAFALSLLGTFLVRSGILTSVHTFASDPVRGVAILALFMAAVGGAFWLYAARLPRLPEETPFLPLSREGLLLLNNILLCTAAGVVLLGTLYPLIVSALRLPPLSVGAPYFNSAVLPLLLPLLFLMPLGIFLPWRAGALRTAWARLGRIVVPLGIAIMIVTVAYLYLLGWHGALALLGFLGGVWAVAGGMLDIRRHWQASDRLQLWPRWLAHIGLGIAVIGMAGAPLDFDTSRSIRAGERFSFAGYDFTAATLPPQAGPNYTDRGLALDIAQTSERLAPVQRIYPAADITTTEAAIRTDLIGDLFTTVSAPDANGAYLLRLRYHPLQVWIWLGAALMVLGGLIGVAGKAR